MLSKKVLVLFAPLLLLVSCDQQSSSKKKSHVRHKTTQINQRASDHPMIAETENGKVQGSEVAPGVYAYRGIPFAQPPIGELRFAPPKSASNWTGTWNATYDRSQCVQVAISNIGSALDPPGAEDCLYLNVYVPLSLQENGSLPVMVWIYGGTFLWGNSSYSKFGPDDLVKKGVILVSFNYRLGIFGFLSTEDKAAPGNYALKDQIFALQWVQRNIAAFGGNPKEVTVFGESAGAASVSYLTLSPAAKGLFKRAISESGSALCPWALSHKARTAAFGVAATLGKATRNSTALVESLRNMDYKDLQRASIIQMGVILALDPLNGLVYAPVIEPPHDGAVITECPYKSLEDGNFNQVNHIIGYNSLEAEGFSSTIKLLQLYLATYDLLPIRLVPSDMNAATHLYTSIGVQIRTHYAGLLGRLTYPDHNVTRYLSDDEFVRPIHKAANLSANYVNDTYLYRFSYTTDPKAVGAGHADELNYLFNSNYTTTSDLAIRECLTTLWTNFAKYDDPTPSGSDACGGVTWNPMKSDGANDIVYLNINRTTTTGVNPNQADMNFWANLYNKYGNSPYCTF